LLEATKNIPSLLKTSEEMVTHLQKIVENNIMYKLYTVSCGKLLTHSFWSQSN